MRRWIPWRSLVAPRERRQENEQAERPFPSPATAEEARIIITQVLGEWELRTRAALVGAVSLPDSASAGADALVLRERTVQRLAALGPVALDPLLHLLRAERGTMLEIRRAGLAAQALGRMGDVRAVPVMLEALRDQRESYAPVRAVVAGVLGQLKAEGAATIYERALLHHSGDDWQADAALLGTVRLETIVEALVGALSDPVAEVRVAAAGACIDLCLEDAPPALLFAGTSGAAAGLPADEQQSARLVLRQAVEPLIAALKDTDAAVRCAAVTALGWIADPRAVKPVIRCLQDADESCRCAAVRALGLLRSPAALKPLARAVADPSSEVRRQAAEALGALGDPVAADLLLDVMHDAAEPLEVRAAAARALGHLRIPQVLPPLQALLKSPEPLLRAAAIEALGRLNFARTYRLLAPLLWREPERSVRHAAARALARLADGRQSRTRWRLRLALRVARPVRQEALLLLEQQAKRERQAPFEKS